MPAMPLIESPRQIYAELFESVQTGGVFADSKTFVDAVPRHEPAAILQHYREQRERADFDLRSFVEKNFILPETGAPGPTPRDNNSIEQRIETLWTSLTRSADLKERHSSLIDLPNPYVVPGGRFRELYYWDSYFTMLGLAASGHIRMVENMVDNFAFLIDQRGFIPNGTRTYYCTRSQAPFFVMMVELLAQAKNDATVFSSYLPQLQAEYAFWMSGAETVREGHSPLRRVVPVGHALLNRYWDVSDQPREESHAQDVTLAARSERDTAVLYRDIRAACEAGWDFSSRWFADGKSMATIRTTDIIPVDLNALLYKLETVLADTCESCGHSSQAVYYRQQATARKDLIQTLFFDEQNGFFVDLNVRDHQTTGVLSLAAAYPLFFGIATASQATRVAARLQRDFLQPGGWVTTLSQSGQQWDAPNGWAPLQWIVFKGLLNYGFDQVAMSGARRWIDNVMGTFRDSGRLLEKYNVMQPGLTPTGGEYDVQDGFGWTNGVLLSLMKYAGQNR
jgi:alpha,alpha-trehalase